MTHINVSLTRNITDPSGHLSGYKISLRPTDEDVSGFLRQDGPVWNDTICLGGTFATEADAARAVLDYVGAMASLVELRDLLSGDSQFRLKRMNARLRYDEGTVARLVGRRNQYGTFIADPAQ